MTGYSSLNRRTPLRRGGQLKRTGQLKRRKRLGGQSSRRRQEQTVRAALAHEHLGARCRIGSDVCTGDAENFHELVGRAQGGSIIDRRQLVPCCQRCNSWIEDHPTVAYANGWKVRQVDAKPGAGGLVPAVPHPLAIANDEEGWL